MSVATASVFGFGVDRDATADLLAVVYSVGLFAGFTTSLINDNYFCRPNDN